MGNFFSEFVLVLPDGLQTTVKSLVIEFCDTKLLDHELIKAKIDEFYDFCLSFAKTVVLTGKADFNHVVDKSLLIGIFGTFTCKLLSKDVLNTCRWVCAGIQKIATNIGHTKGIYAALKEVASTLAKNAKTPYMKFFFDNVVDNARARGFNRN